MKLFILLFTLIVSLVLGTYSFSQGDYENSQKVNDEVTDLQQNNQKEIVPANQPEMGPPPFPPMEEFFKLCKNDFEKFCKNVPPGPGMMECLFKNIAGLSKECATAVNKMVEQHKKMEAMKKACEADFLKYCKKPEPNSGVFPGPIAGPGPHGPMKCIKDNFAKFTPACQKAINELPPPPHPFR